MQLPEVTTDAGEQQSHRAPERTAIRTGLEGGALGTLGMMVARRVGGSKSGAPPTAAFWAKYVGDGEPGDYEPQGLVLHFLYGAVSGAVFQLLRSVVGRRRSERAESHPVTGGIAFGVLLAAWGFTVILQRVLGKDPGPEKASKFLKGHLAYGLTLGAWTKMKERI